MEPALFLSLLLACPAPTGTPADSAGGGADSAADTGTGDTADTGADTGDTGDTGLVVPEDNVARALGDCEGLFATPDEYPNQLIPGDELQRYTLHDPAAVCNDGTRAVLYVRPATDPDLATVWDLHVQGGGICTSWAECAERYCGTAYYDASKTSSAYAPVEIGAVGILDSSPENLLAGANHAFFYYCSSDLWNGQGSVRYESPDGVQPAFTMFERGHTILTSGIAELEAGLVADGGVEMPPLTEASLVVFNGTSAGNHGAQSHLDWLDARLGENGTRVFGIFDAGNDPARDVFPEASLPAYDAAYAALWDTLEAGRDHTPWVDESCADRYAGTDDAWRCVTSGVLTRNHLTTPFFLRQDLTDVSLFATAFGLPEDSFEALMQVTLETQPDIGATSLEPIAVAPGVFGPNCGQHVALETDDWWRVATVQTPEGAFTFQDAVLEWVQGDRVVIVDEAVTGVGTGPSSDCPAVDGEH